MKTSNLRNKLLIATCVAALSACTQYAQPICNQDAIEWDKWGTPDLPIECQPPETTPIIETLEDNDDEEPRTPSTPTEPDTPDVPDVPDDPDEPHRPDTDEPVDGRGNPGNDKPVGRAGEQDKHEGDSGGTRGASTGKN